MLQEARAALLAFYEVWPAPRSVLLPFESPGPHNDWPALEVLAPAPALNSAIHWILEAQYCLGDSPAGDTAFLQKLVFDIKRGADIKGDGFSRLV